MSKLNLDDVIKLADLAKIEITNSEAENYLQDINNILGHLSSVSGAQTNNAEQNFRFVNNLRPDNLDARDFDKQIIFDDMPNKSANNYVKVSKVIKK